jgi:hypothetical protein
MFGMGKKTVNGVLAGFVKIMEDLNGIISEETRLNYNRDDEIEVLKKAQITSTAEIIRAEKILANMQKLVGDE